MHKGHQYPIAEDPRGDGKVETRMLVQPALDKMRASLENSYLVFPPTNIYSLFTSFCDAQTFQWSTWHWLLHKFPLTRPNFLNLAAAKSLQSCPTLCDPIDGSPPGSPVPAWDSPGKNTGVGCHFLLQCMKVKSESEIAQSCPTLSDPMDCSLPGSSIHGIFQARVLEWGAIAFSDCMYINLLFTVVYKYTVLLI